MSPKTIGYWVATGLFSLAMFGSGVMDLTLPEEFKAQIVGHMGLPVYFPPILGAWKVLGVVALLAPGFPKIKEWAYAGYFFTLTGAIASHLALGDGIGGALPPAVLLSIAATSYALRPAGRTFGEPLLSLTPARSS